MADPLAEHESTLPPSPTSPSAARRVLRDALVACGRLDLADAAELAVSELVTNVVLHAHTDLTLRIRYQPGELRVEVEDANAAIPSQPGYGDASMTGRGLALVAAVAAEHGVVRTDTGKITWFVLSDRAAAGEESPDRRTDRRVGGRGATRGRP